MAQNLSLCKDDKDTNFMDHIRHQGELLYPDVGIKTRRVPPVKFNVQKLREQKTRRRVDCKVLDLPTATDIESNRVENIVSGAFECLSNDMVHNQTGTAMFIISNFEYDNYLNKIDLSELAQNRSMRSGEKTTGKTESCPGSLSSTDQRPANRPVVKLPKDVAKRGELDILILQQEAGIVLVQTKAVGYNFKEPASLDPSIWECYIPFIQKALVRAGEQLSRDRHVILHVMEDLGLRDKQITSIIALPNLSRKILQLVLNNCDSLKHMVCNEFGLNPDQNFLCEEDFQLDSYGRQTALENWWKQKLLTQTGNVLELEIMKEVAYRTVGLASTVSVWSFTQPRIEVRNLNDAAFETGNRYTQVILSSQQAEILKREEKYFYIWGPAGSGKTLLLSLKGRQWLRRDCNDCDVVILNTRLGSKGRKVGQVMENTINKTKGLNKKAIRIDLDLAGDELAFETDILKQVKKGSHVRFLLDEVTWVNETNKLMSVLKRCFPNSTIWCAGMLSECCPLGFDSDTLLDILRCPPWVQRVLRVVDNRQNRSDLYTLDSVNAGLPTDGPRPHFIIHSDHGPPSVQPYDCAICARKLSDFLLKDLNMKQDTNPNSAAKASHQKPADKSFSTMSEDWKQQPRHYNSNKDIPEQSVFTQSEQADTNLLYKADTHDQPCWKGNNQNKKSSKKLGSKDASYYKHAMKDGDPSFKSQYRSKVSEKALPESLKFAPSPLNTRTDHSEVTSSNQCGDYLTAGSDSGCGSAGEADICDVDFDQDGSCASGLDTYGFAACSQPGLPLSEKGCAYTTHSLKPVFQNNSTAVMDLTQTSSDNEGNTPKWDTFQPVPQNSQCKSICGEHRTENFPSFCDTSSKIQHQCVASLGKKPVRQNSKSRKKQRDASRQNKETTTNNVTTTRGNSSGNAVGSRLHFSDAVMPVTMPQTWHHYSNRGYWAISQQALAQNMVMMGSCDFIRQLHESGVPVRVEVGMVQLNKEKETGNRFAMCPLGSVHGLEYKVVVAIPSSCALPEYKDINQGIVNGKMWPQVNMKRTKFAEKVNEEEERIQRRQKTESCRADQTSPCEFQEETDSEGSDKVRISTHVEGPPMDILYEAINLRDPVLTVINGQLSFQARGASEETGDGDSEFDNFRFPACLDNEVDAEGMILKQRLDNCHLNSFTDIMDVSITKTKAIPSKEYYTNQATKTHETKKDVKNRTRYSEEGMSLGEKMDIPAKQAPQEPSALLSSSLTSPTPSPSSCSPPQQPFSAFTSPVLPQSCCQLVPGTDSFQHHQLSSSSSSQSPPLSCPRQTHNSDQTAKGSSLPESPPASAPIDAALSKRKEKVCRYNCKDNCACQYFIPRELEALHRLNPWNKAYVLMCASRCTSQLILVLP